MLFYRADVWGKLAKQGFQLFAAKGKWVAVRRSAEEAKDLCVFRLRYVFLISSDLDEPTLLSIYMYIHVGSYRRRLPFAQLSGYV